MIFQRLAKTDIDWVADQNWQAVDRCLQRLMSKLYLRNPEALYNSAGNVEILIGRLNNRRNTAAQPLLHSNGVDRPPYNLSFERLLGKLIA